MKILIYFLLCGALTGLVYGQTEDVPAVKDSLTEDMLIGDCVREDFQDTSFAKWFDEEYSDYKIDTAAADSLSEIIDNVEIAVIIGTWCSDSRREIPRFLKILDYLKYPSEKLIMKCVDRKLKTLSSDIDIYNVEAVPVIIFYREGKEIGRITEAPDDSLERDMAKIITN